MLEILKIWIENGKIFVKCITDTKKYFDFVMDEKTLDVDSYDNNFLIYTAQAANAIRIHYWETGELMEPREVWWY